METLEVRIFLKEVFLSFENTVSFWDLHSRVVRVQSFAFSFFSDGNGLLWVAEQGSETLNSSCHKEVVS